MDGVRVTLERARPVFYARHRPGAGKTLSGGPHHRMFTVCFGFGSFIHALLDILLLHIDNIKVQAQGSISAWTDWKTWNKQHLQLLVSHSYLR